MSAWTLLRRPLLLLLVAGCFVSIEVSGRFSLRLIADGAVSFAFLPLVEIGSLALVTRRRRDAAFAGAVDRFLESDRAWLLWIVAMAAIRAVESPVVAAAQPRPLFWAKAVSAVPVALWTARLDLPLLGSVRALVTQRLIAWTCAGAWFFGLAVWAYVVGYL